MKYDSKSIVLKRYKPVTPPGSGYCALQTSFTAEYMKYVIMSNNGSSGLVNGFCEDLDKVYNSLNPNMIYRELLSDGNKYTFYMTLTTKYLCILWI